MVNAASESNFAKNLKLPICIAIVGYRRRFVDDYRIVICTTIKNSLSSDLDSFQIMSWLMSVSTSLFWDRFTDILTLMIAKIPTKISNVHLVITFVTLSLCETWSDLQLQMNSDSLCTNEKKTHFWFLIRIIELDRYTCCRWRCLMYQCGYLCFLLSQMAMLWAT